MAQNISHGRGGAANIRPDDTIYTDGEIVREGPVGDQGDGKYSAGRGGTGNIAGQGVPERLGAGDTDYIPETATHIAKEESHHVGRGGAGNSLHVHEKKADSGEGIIGKVKDLFGGKK